MVFVNEALAWATKPASLLRDFLILLHPFAPHLAEELWAKLQSHLASCLGTSRPASDIALSYQPWPTFDPAMLVEDTLEFPVQVNGKLRDKILLPRETPREDIEKAALASSKVQSFIGEKTVRKIIIVPNKLVNVVVG
jgi:leucyl-tRNA synthetase